ncbi:MAG: ribosome maturation factor RimP [Deltaproteobacteria bacterium]|nr:ribosome maturation factor RimP [Deltaproteobacteria bacterium]
MGYTEELKNRIQDLLEPLAEGQDLELVDLELHRARRGRTLLRIFLDRPGGITLEEITRFSRVAGELLDVHDLIPESYNLEVSSPGLTRELKKPRDYERYAGRLVRLTTRSVINGRQVHRGILLGLEADVVTLEEEGQVRSIPLGEIARARLDIDMKKMSKEG